VNLPSSTARAKSLELPIGAPNLVAIIVMALFAFAEAVALTQSDGDLFAHIRLGQIILARWEIPSSSVLGFSYAFNAVYPAWLSAVWFAALFRAGGLAFINSIGNLGGFIGPFAVGWLKDHTANGFQAGLTFLAACLLTGSVVAVIVGRRVARIRAAEQMA